MMSKTCAAVAVALAAAIFVSSAPASAQRGEITTDPRAGSLPPSSGPGGPLRGPLSSCQNYSTDNASQSNDTAFTSAEGFALLAAGAISEVCWYGAYLPNPSASDAFVMTYYTNSAGLPGGVLASFTEGVDLTITPRVDTGDLVAGIAIIWEYCATHPTVTIPGDTCHWLEAKNDPPGGETWFWEWSHDGDDTSLVDAGPNGYDPGDVAFGHDFAFCFDEQIDLQSACFVIPAELIGVNVN